MVISNKMATMKMCNQCLSKKQYFILTLNHMYSNLPKITLPQPMLLHLERARKKASAKKHQVLRTFKGPVIISCRRPRFNHHKGQTYSGFNPQMLASGGWKHHKSAGDHFTINAICGNPALVLDEGCPSSFEEMNLHPALLQGLKSMNIITPTNIQALTIPQMLDMKNILCAAETGSGKTLAYLLPIIQKMLMHQRIYNDTNIPNEPYGVIVTPSRELADQIHNVADKLCSNTPFTAKSISGGRGTQKLLRNPPCEVVDLLISTPGVFSKLLSNKVYGTGRLHHIVLDEADTLLDDSFSDLTKRLLNKLKVQSIQQEFADEASQQVALVGATIPRSLKEILGQVVPVDTIEHVTTSHLHRLMPHVPQKFVRVKKSEKPEYLLGIVKNAMQKKIPVMIFCKNSNTACFASMFLQDNGFENILMHANMPQKVRDGMFERFQESQCNILVCTDIASRGLDTTRVQHVINYDFPTFMSDYIHRAGRVGRVGSQGMGFVHSLVSEKWDVDLLWKIEAGARRRTELHNVNANIKRKLMNLKREKETVDMLEAPKYQLH